MIAPCRSNSVIVAGVDYGTLSVRVSIFDSQKGRLGSATAEYPLFRKKDDPDHATQSQSDQMEALAVATRKAIQAAGVRGDQIEAIALDTTGSSVVPVGPGLVPLDDYYMWCDHRAKGEAAEITAAGRQERLEALEWCGGVYSSEWGFSKVLHWLRHNSGKRAEMVTALEHCDMLTAVLCGITDPRQAPGLSAVWPAIATGLASQDADVIADCGRLDVGASQPLSVLAEARMVIMVLRPTLRQVAAAKPRIELASQVLSSRDRLGLLLVGDGALRPADIAKTLEVRVVGTLPNDPGTAAVLSDGNGKRHRLGWRGQAAARRW